MISSKVAKAMAASGCSAEQIAAVMEVLDVVNEERYLARKANDRERQRRHREKSKGEENQQSCHVTSRYDGVTECDNPSPLSSPLDKESPPTPLKEINPPYNPPIPFQHNLLKSEFESFWLHYPRKTSRKMAERAFAKARVKTPLETITDGLYAYLATKPDPNFTPHASTWLNQERWNDQHPISTAIIPLRKPLSNQQQAREKTDAIAASTVEYFNSIMENRPAYSSSVDSRSGQAVPAIARYQPREDAGHDGNLFDLPGNHAPADSPPRNGHGH